MRIKLDENLPASLVSELESLGHDVDTVPQEGLRGTADDEVWPAAQAAGRFLVTQDLDFSDAGRFEPGTHSGLMIVRLREPGRAALIDPVRWAFEQEPAEGWERCLVVVSEHKVRVRRPSQQ